MALALALALAMAIAMALALALALLEKILGAADHKLMVLLASI